MQSLAEAEAELITDSDQESSWVWRFGWSILCAVAYASALLVWHAPGVALSLMFGGHHAVASGPGEVTSVLPTDRDTPAATRSMYSAKEFASFTCMCAAAVLYDMFGASTWLRALVSGACVVGVWAAMAQQQPKGAKAALTQGFGGNQMIGFGDRFSSTTRRGMWEETRRVSRCPSQPPAPSTLTVLTDLEACDATSRLSADCNIPFNQRTSTVMLDDVAVCRA